MASRLRIAKGDKSKVGWPQLKKEDIRCMQDTEELLRKVEKQRRAEERQTQREREEELPAIAKDDDDAGS
jgi:hypothetical protein